MSLAGRLLVTTALLAVNVAAIGVFYVHKAIARPRPCDCTFCRFAGGGMP